MPKYIKSGSIGAVVTMSIVRLLPRRLLSSTACLAAKPPVQLLHVPKLDSETEHLLARQWIDAFTLEDIPKEGWVATRSRSSGPGGQVSSSALDSLSTMN